MMFSQFNSLTVILSCLGERTQFLAQIITVEFSTEKSVTEVKITAGLHSGLSLLRMRVSTVQNVGSFLHQCGGIMLSHQITLVG